MERLPDSTRLGTVHLQVADLARSLAFYEEIIGLRPLKHTADGIVLAAAHDTLPLIELHERPGIHTAPRRGRLGLYHVAILLPNRESLGAFVAHLGARFGAQARGPNGSSIGMADHFVSEAIYLADPDGLGLEVYADRSRDQWQYRGGELTMGTESLDVASLMRAASAAPPWSGAPHGTTIGHVHLRVNDLDAASRIYHDLIGFDRQVWSYPGALFLSAAGYHHHLGINTWGGHHVTAPSPDEAQLLEWTVLVSDTTTIDRLADRLSADRQTVTRDDRSLTFVDPAGTRLRITAG